MPVKLKAIILFFLFLNKTRINTNINTKQYMNDSKLCGKKFNISHIKYIPWNCRYTVATLKIIALITLSFLIYQAIIAPGKVNKVNIPHCG